MTPQQLTDAFEKAGLDTPEKLASHLAVATDSTALRDLDEKIATLTTERDTAIAPFRDKLVELSNQRASIASKLGMR